MYTDTLTADHFKRFAEQGYGVRLHSMQDLPELFASTPIEAWCDPTLLVTHPPPLVPRSLALAVLQPATQQHAGRAQICAQVALGTLPPLAPTPPCRPSVFMRSGPQRAEPSGGVCGPTY